MPRSGPQRAWSPRRVRYLPAVAAVVDDRVEREAPLPNPGRLAPSPDLLTAARGDGHAVAVAVLGDSREAGSFRGNWQCRREHRLKVSGANDF